MFFKNKNKKIRRQEIRYTYSDANMIEAINKYLNELDKNEKNFKLLKLSFIFSERKIIIIFKSSFEVRRMIADKLRQYDSEAPLLRLQRIMEAEDKIVEDDMAKYESEQVEPTIVSDDEIDVDTGERLKIGDSVRHFKGNKFLILAFAKHTESGKKLVIYQSLNGDKQVYAKHYGMFMGKVDKNKYPDATQEYRFELYDPTQSDEDENEEI